MTAGPLLSLIYFCSLICFLCSSYVSAQNPVFPCDVDSNKVVATYGFCNTALSFSEWAADLVKRLTLQEKIKHIIDQTPAIPRLGIPSYNWWPEALHWCLRCRNWYPVLPTSAQCNQLPPSYSHRSFLRYHSLRIYWTGNAH
jgi:hypothetical protein